MKFFNFSFEIFTRPWIDYLFILILFIFYIFLQWNSLYDSDEFEHLYAVLRLKEGFHLYSDVWQVHGPLLYWIGMMLPLKEDCQVIERFRYISLITSLLTTVILFVIAKINALPPKSILFCCIINTIWIKKMAELRPDSLLVFFTALILLLLSLENKKAWIKWDIVYYLIGLLFCLIFFCTIKGIIVIACMTAGFFLIGINTVNIVKIYLGLLISSLLIFGILFFQGNVIHYWNWAIEWNLHKFSFNNPFNYMRPTDSAIYILSWTGLFIVSRTNTPSQIYRFCSIFFITFNALLIFIPQIYSQTLLPLLLFSSFLADRAIRIFMPFQIRPLVYILLFGLFIHDMGDKVSGTDANRKLQMVRSIVLKITEPGEFVLDSKGETLFRPRPTFPLFVIPVLEGIYNHYLLLDLEKDVLNNNCQVIWSYKPGLSRLPLSSDFLSHNYILLNNLPFQINNFTIYVSGIEIANSLSKSNFFINFPGFYRILAKENTKISIDNQEIKNGAILKLGKSIHSIETDAKVVIIKSSACDYYKFE